MAFVKVANKKDIPPGAATAVEVEGKKIAIFNVGNQYFAIDDTCTHAGGPLSEGSVEGFQVNCPWHGAAFDLKTGEALCAPAFEAISCYNVKVEADDIKIEI